MRCARGFAEAFRATPPISRDVYREFTDFIVPYATGNVHPGFMGWVHGGGTAGRHAGGDAGGRTQRQSRRPRSHADRGRAPDRGLDAADVRLSARRQRHFRHRHLDGQSDGGAGRADDALGRPSRQHGLGEDGALADGLYVEGGAWLHRQGDGHRRVSAAMRCACIAVDECHRIDVAALRAQIAQRSRRPAASRSWWSASAGTVDIGAIDDLGALARRSAARRSSGSTSTALLARSRSSRQSLRRGSPASNSANSIALDFHKWGQVPYDAGFLLVRDGERHRDAFAAPAAYLRRETRGLAAGPSGPAISVRICRAASGR